PGAWVVKEGVLVGGTAGDLVSHLFHEREDFTDFHLRAEVLLNEGGNSGLLFRTRYGEWFDLQEVKGKGKVPLGYEADLAADGPDASGMGDVWCLAPNHHYQRAKDVAFKRDAWLTLEVVARGDRIITKLGGTTLLDYRDPAA